MALLCLMGSLTPLVAKEPRRRPRFEYPEAFVHPPRAGALGIGFAPLYPQSVATSCSLATASACRSLSWALRVRVRGEQLFEGDGRWGFQFRGESLALLDTPTLTPEVCQFDTVRLGRRVWVTARPPGDRAVLGPVAPLPRAAPDWVRASPPLAGHLVSVGTAAVAYNDEPGSWELAEYYALRDLALARQARIANVAWSDQDGSLVGHEAQVDVLLVDFRVLARWRDATQVYVLAAIPCP